MLLITNCVKYKFSMKANMNMSCVVYLFVGWLTHRPMCRCAEYPHALLFHTFFKLSNSIFSDYGHIQPQCAIYEHENKRKT